MHIHSLMNVFCLLQFYSSLIFLLYAVVKHQIRYTYIWTDGLYGKSLLKKDILVLIKKFQLYAFSNIYILIKYVKKLSFLSCMHVSSFYKYADFYWHDIRIIYFLHMQNLKMNSVSKSTYVLFLNDTSYFDIVP